jgi:hypothetical protein
MKFHTFIIVFTLLSTCKIFSQESFEGYILCIDNKQIAEEAYNEYYFLPLDFNKK